MVAVGLWCGQAYVMDNEHRSILLMAFWMPWWDTVMRAWGPLLCHSSTSITSCCSMIMHGPMFQGSVYNSWKLKTSQFLHGQHTHWACHPLNRNSNTLSYTRSSFCQYPATSHSHWRGVDQHSTGHNQQPDQLYVKEMFYTAWGKMVVTPDTDWFRTLPEPPPPQYSKTAHFRVAFY